MANQRNELSLLDLEIEILDHRQRAFGRGVDFVKLAEAYGAKGFVANGPAELESTLKKALAMDAPVLIEVPVGPMPSPFFRPS